LLRGPVKVTSTIASDLPSNISETIRDRGLVPKDPQLEMAYGVSNGHVTPKGQACDSNMLRAQYLENSWSCYLATITNY